MWLAPLIAIETVLCRSAGALTVAADASHIMPVCGLFCNFASVKEIT